MKDKNFIALGALNMCIAIGAGAFGAHALKQSLSTDMLAVWQTAANYQIFHALGLIIIGLLMSKLESIWIQRAGFAMMFGIIVFSGSLYLLSITGIKILGAITPIGGVAFLFAWLSVAYSAYKS